MSINLNKKEIIFSALGAALILGLVLFFLGLYPVALVEGKAITAKEWKQNLQVARKLDPKLNEKIVFDQMIKNEQKAALAEELNLGDNSTWESERKYYMSGNPQDYTKLINDYFSGNEKLFEKYVLKPQAVDSLLRIKYNFDFNANKDAYNKARGILTMLEQGQRHEDLAKILSDDRASGQLGGDLGFFKSGELLPELEKIVLNASLGQVQKNIAVSRLGYHILYPVESSMREGEKIWHLKHILIQTTGYETWLNSQLNQVKVWRIIKL